MTETTATSRTFHSFRADVEALTCWTSIADEDLLQYERIKRLDVHYSQHNKRWSTLEGLCEDENHPLESVTAFVKFASTDDTNVGVPTPKHANAWYVEQCLKNAANHGLKRHSAIRALKLPEPTNTNHASAFCHFVGNWTGQERTREIRFSANILDQFANENDRARVLECLANLKGVTSITLEYAQRGNALTSVLEALAASPAAKSLQTFSMMLQSRALNTHNNALQVESVCALQKLLEASSSSLLALQMSGFTWRLQNLAPLAAGLEACCSSLVLLDMSDSQLMPDCSWVFHRFFQETKSLQHLSFARSVFQTQDTIVSLIMGLSRNSSLVSLDLDHLDNLSQVYRGGDFGMAIRNLLAGHWRLQSLRLSKNIDLGQQNLEKIAEGAAESRVLKELFLDTCGMDGDSVTMLIGALFSNMQHGGFFGSKPSLTTLDLSGNSLGQQGAEAIASFLSDPSCFLQKLVLNSSEIDDECMLALLPGLVANRALLSLSISGNDFVTVQVWKEFAVILPKLHYLQHLEIQCSSAPRMAQENDSGDADMIHRYPTFAQLKLLYKSFLHGLEKNRSILDNSISFGIGEDNFGARASFIAHRNRALPHLPQLDSHERGGAGLWPHILSKLVGKSWGSHDGPSLAFHLMSTRPEALFARHNVTSPAKKRQKRSGTGLCMTGLTETLPKGY